MLLYRGNLCAKHFSILTLADTVLVEYNIGRQASMRIAPREQAVTKHILHTFNDLV